MINPELLDITYLPSLTLTDRRPLPSCAAVYLVIDGDVVIYIGQSTNLILRWRRHHKLNQINSRGTDIRLAWLECSDSALLVSI